MQHHSDQPDQRRHVMRYQDVVVIGAGIIGLSIALKLQNEGRQVTLVDRQGVAAEASSGNAGAFAFADIIPLATPGILSKAPKWLFDPLGPLSIRPAYVLKILPWMWHFWQASQPSRYNAALSAQAQLMSFSKQALERQIKLVQGESLIRREGQLQVYEGEAEFNASLPSWQTRKEYGVAFDLLTQPEAIAEIQPGLHPRFTHAGFTPEWKNVVDPMLWAQHLADLFVSRGGKIQLDSVQHIELKDKGVLIKGQNKDYEADYSVVACGAWSKCLAQQLGDNLPLETERGYNTTLPTTAFDLKTQLTFSNHGFVVTKVEQGIRVGGAVELGGLHLPANYQRATTLLNKAAQFLPELHTENGKQWMGFRPSMPDSLPVISYSSRSQRVVYAFGHGHLGLTQSAGTAELVYDLIARRPNMINLYPYRASRFSTGRLH